MPGYLVCVALSEVRLGTVVHGDHDRTCWRNLAHTRAEAGKHATPAMSLQERGRE